MCIQKGKRTKRNSSAKAENEIIRMEEIRTMGKTRNTVGSKYKNEEIKGSRGTKEEKEEIRTSQRRYKTFSPQNPVVANRTLQPAMKRDIPTQLFLHSV
jgi:hypothetical protein